MICLYQKHYQEFYNTIKAFIAIYLCQSLLQQQEDIWQLSGKSSYMINSQFSENLQNNIA